MYVCTKEYGRFLRLQSVHEKSITNSQNCANQLVVFVIVCRIQDIENHRMQMFFDEWLPGCEILGIRTPVFDESTVVPRYSDSFRQQEKSHYIEESHYFEEYLL